MMNPHLPGKGKPTFNYPDDQLLRIDGIVSKERLLSPDMLDSNNEPCLIVIKDGNTTGATIGRASGMQSFVRNEKTGEKSTELAIYCYNKNLARSQLKETLVRLLSMDLAIWLASSLVGLRSRSRRH